MSGKAWVKGRGVMGVVVEEGVAHEESDSSGEGAYVIECGVGRVVAEESGVAGQAKSSGGPIVQGGQLGFLQAQDVVGGSKGFNLLPFQGPGRSRVAERGGVEGAAGGKGRGRGLVVGGKVVRSRSRVHLC